jgi:hypothetical protein
MSTLLPEVLSKYKKNNIFLETGSYKGGGIQVALNAGFDLVLSIEIHKDYHEMCKEKFKTEISNDQVELYHGDCLNVLKEILPAIDEPITFWLDAHIDWECGVSGKTPSPLIYELQMLKELSPCKNHTILIDDMRVFRTKIGWGQFNPVGQKEIEEAILAINPNYKICYEPNAVQEDDVLVAYIP